MNSQAKNQVIVFEEDGAVDGFLFVQWERGQPEFCVRDSLDGRVIRCEVAPEIQSIALQWVTRRVEVMGMVGYVKDGVPVMVRAREVIPFPPQEDIPSPAEMRQLLGGAQ